MVVAETSCSETSAGAAAVLKTAEWAAVELAKPQSLA